MIPDNNHDNDAVAPGVVTAADVTIITTERTFVLPKFYSCDNFPNDDDWNDCVPVFIEC
ncbi:MAG: hypothetical protein CM15mP47_0790 [Methanobacteriota archaeon]|nr:MAG: hypothetical protein CM15mP47_0790 [Euryarchaeota archaeon]